MTGPSPISKSSSGRPPQADARDGRKTPISALAVGEALLQRLIHDGRYDIARKLCDVACEEEAPAAVKDHFEDRMARIDLVGKPAPPIAGTDVDGKPVSLAELKGKVVLIDFWASWCPPCVAAIPTLKALSQKYQDRGFVILGVNVDAMHEDVKEPDAALQQRPSFSRQTPGRLDQPAERQRGERFRRGLPRRADPGQLSRRSRRLGRRRRPARRNAGASRRKRPGRHVETSEEGLTAMFFRRLVTVVTAMALLLSISGGTIARAQIGLPGLPENPTLDYFGLGEQSTPLAGSGDFSSASGFVGNPFSTAGYGSVGGYGISPYDYGVSPYGYGVQTGQVASGYRPAGSLYSNVYQGARPQTTVNYQPLFNAITALPGWNRSVHRTRRRLHSVSNAPRPSNIIPFDDAGKIMWPSAISNDSATAKLRQGAEDAVRTVVRESKSTGHGSVRLVVDAKNKLSAFERQVLPGVRNKNRTDGAAVEAFFYDLDHALDALTFRY